MATPATPPTAQELIDALSALDPATPVLVSTHYDNDIGHAADVEIRVGEMYPTEGAFWTEFNRADLEPGERAPAGVARVGIITARGDV